MKFAMSSDSKIAKAAVARFIELYKNKRNDVVERMKDKTITPKTVALLRACYAVAKDRL